MRNFQKIAEGVNVGPLLHAVVRQPELWNVNKLRTTHPGTPHTQVDDIWLRFNDLNAYKKTGDSNRVVDEHESIWYPAADKLPQARQLIFMLMTMTEGERLGRVLITRMKPGTKISAHVDGGEHAAYYDRYHVTLQSAPGFQFRAGDESVHMKPGEVWWFDNSKEHELANNSPEDRLTMIVDIRTKR